MSKLITRIKRLALALCFVTPLVSWADAITAVNPVTGETETYTYKFIGTDTWDGTEYWQDSDGNNPSAVPAKSGDNTWEPILFDGNTININASMSVEGWNLRMGLYNGANVTMNNFVKYQGDTTMWMTVDENSQLTIGGFGGGNITANQVIKLSVAKANGITWTANLTSANANNTFEYYLAGEGSVSYQGVTAANHKIKQADVALSGNEKSVQSKTLVSFTSTDKTFTADAAIKVKNGDNVLKTVYLTSVTADATTLTTDDDVGACELVQTSTGIDLYWVDGDPAALPAPTVYKPSISINFTDSGSGLTTGADVGLTDYEVPGTSWNNFAGSNGTYGEVKAVADSTGSASVMSGVSVTVSGTRGSWATSLPSSSNPLAGYIDENAGNSTPTVTVTGIPYYKYRVLVYHSTDTANVTFGYDTINGTNYTYVEDALSEGTTAWGNSGPDGSADAIAEGGNVLVTEAISGSTLTVVGHRGGGDSSARGCIAAIQIIEVKADVGENDLEIAVDGEREYMVTAEDAEKTGTVYLTGSGTLTLAGENKISAATIEVGDLVTLVVNADRLDGTTFVGGGTVVYDGVVPPTGKGWTESAWSGTVWIKNKSGITGNNNASTGVQPNSLGNSLSKVKFSGVNGWIEAPVTYDPEIVLENAGYDYALQLTDGNSPNNSGYPNRTTNIKKLSGSGKLCRSNTKGAAPALKVYDASGFTGSIDTSSTSGGLIVIFCEESTEFPADIVAMFIDTNKNKSIYVASGKTVTLDSAATWTAVTGFGVEGTLVANGTLASSASAAVTGAGTVVFNGKAPDPTGDTWWKNTGWTGTVQVKSVDNMVGSGSGTILAFNDYGNEGSTLELNGCTGWLPGPYECTVPLKITGTLNLNNGLSDRDHIFTINHLKGNGTIYGGSTADKVIIRVKEWSEFTGLIQLDKKIVVFGEDEMPVKADLTAGQIIVSAGAVVTAANSTANGWWATGGIKVNGELRSPDLTRFGGGTTITTTDNGIFTLTDSSNTDDKAVDYARITGTGTLRYADVSGKWRSLSAVNFPTGMICENNLSEGLILTTRGENTIGSLAGSGAMRSDWGGSKNVGDRTLKILQAKNTTYSGVFHSDDRITTVTVAPGASSAGTLTLSGTQTVSNDLAIESGAAVNLTGTWVGATTVAGTFGGTGTLTGDLTFAEGSTFKAFAADDADGLVVSGTVTYPAEGKVTVDVSAIEPEADVALIKANGLDADNFALTGATEGATLEVVEGVLTLIMPTPVVARYAGVDYATIAEAIAAALADEGGAANIANIEVVDTTAEVPAGYYIDGTSIVQYPVVLVKDGEAHSYYNAVGAAIQAVFMTLGGQYDYVEIVAGNSFDLPLGMLAAIKVKNTANAEPVLDGVADDCTWSAEAGESYITYTKVNKPTVYTWTGGAVEHRWGNRSNWSFVDSNEDTVAASRTPEAGDTVVFNTDVADVVIGSDPAVVAINVGAAVTISKEYEAEVAITVTDAIVLTDVDATLTVSGVTLNPTPTTTVEGCVVVAEGTGPVTYAVAETVTFTLPEVAGATVESVVGATDNGNGTYTAIIGDTVTVTWVADEGKVVTGGVKEFVATAETAAANIPTPDSVVDAIALDPAEMELYPNCSNYVWVVNAPEGSTYTFKFDNTHVGSGGYSSTLGWAKPYAKRPGSGTVTAYVTNNNEQVAMLVCNVTVKDVVAVVNGEEYTTAQWETAVADAIDNDQVLEVYYNVANITLPVGQTLKWKAADNRGQGKVTVLAPGATESAMYKVTSTKDTETGITTVVCTNEGAPNVEHTSADGQTVTYYATLSMSKTGTYRILRDMEVAGVSVNSKGAVTLDLNGKTLTATGSNAGVLVYPAITGTSTTLTITGGGTVNVTGTNPDGVPAVWAARTGRVIIESGTFIGYRISVYASDTATATINGGTFRSIDSSDGLLNCEDTNKGAITVTGGTFEGFNPANNGADGAGTNYVPDGYRSTETSTGVWEVTEIPAGIDPTDPTSTQEVTPSEQEIADAGSAEAAAKAKATVTVPEAVATATGVTEETYKSYFTLSATETSPGSGVYDVAIVELNEDVVFPTSESDDLTADLADVLDVAADTPVAITTAKPGLYYSIEAADNVGFTGEGTVEGERELATTTTVSPAKPAKTGDAVFYRVKVSATQE